MTDRKFCRDCKHFFHLVAGMVYREPICLLSEPDPVFGARNVPCRVERLPGGPCGIEGKLFEAPAPESDAETKPEEKTTNPRNRLMR